MVRVSLTKAKAQLTELVRRAEEGEVVQITRHNQVVATINRPQPELSPSELREKRRKAIEKFQAAIAALPPSPGPDAAHAADFLYGPDGMPN